MAACTGRRWEIVPIGFELHKPHPAKTTHAQRVEQLEAVQVDALVLERRHPKRETSVVCARRLLISDIAQKDYLGKRTHEAATRLKHAGIPQRNQGARSSSTARSSGDLAISFARQPL